MAQTSPVSALRRSLDRKGIFFFTLAFHKNLHVGQTALLAQQNWISQNSCRFLTMSAPGSKRAQPPWSPPSRPDLASPDSLPGVRLKLYNSLTRGKEPFVPQRGNRVTWYNCGPTVYDASHMGHARTYLSFDILRRVLRDYFNYDVFFVENITDIDDKIIRRARQNHLYEQYAAEDPDLSRVLADCNEVLVAFGETVKKTVDADKKAMQEKQFKTLTEAVVKAEALVKKSSTNEKEAKAELLTAAKDLISDWLDKKRGSEVTQNEIFSDLPRYWEQKFHEDMDALNILPPDCLTRVSEYVPENVAFVQKIIDSGFGYESNGSVYFDVAKFDADPGHHYAKLVPEAFGNQSALKEGEGDLTVAGDGEKRSDNDFAVWKNSKPGEPSWESPWGRGRPGWHIECSVMASEILGESMDIHSGGVDLKFPHHDNELAQSEAYHGNDHWIRYFLHSGHLTIAGCKMSKSLKNFITIQEVLKRYTARQLRLTFLLHSWKDTLDYSDATMESAISYEKTVNEFFLTVKHVMRSNPGQGVAAFRKWGDDESALNNALRSAMDGVHAALCDNVDTKAALDQLRELVAAGNDYLKKKSGGGEHNRALLKDSAAYITRIFDIFGLIARPEEVGFPARGAQSEANAEETVMPYLNAMADFRDNVRKAARELKAVEILQECDRLRDDVLPDLGVRLEDKEKEATVIKLVDREELMRERQQKRELEAANAAKKEKKKAEAAAKAKALEELKKIPPTEMFKPDNILRFESFKSDPKYSKFDDKGMPTHDASGEEIAKAQLKKLQKLYAAQEKKYNEYVKSKSNEQ